MNPVAIDDARVQLVLASEESHFLDLKSKRTPVKKLAKAISAFANADGGELYLGIEEIDRLNKHRSWDGFARIEDANDHLQEITKHFPFGSGFNFIFLSNPDKPGYVLKLEIEKSTRIIKTPDGEIYVRLGASSIPQSTPDQVRRLEYNKGIRSFEDERVQTDPRDIENSVISIRFMLQIVPEAEPENWLRKQKMIVEDLPTVCGVMLFSDEPQIALPKTAIKIYRYKGSDSEGFRENLMFDPISMEGCAYDIIFNAVDKVKDIIEKIKVVGTVGLQEVSYPSVALHEIITNAVLHRDYSVADDVHIRIFDNRLEIESPGRLPAHITEKNILQERFLRNGKLVRLINKFPNPPNKDVGEGLNSSFQAMRELKYKDPIITQRDNSVLVILRHEKSGSAEEIISNYLQTNEEINNATARRLCFIGDANMMAGKFKKMVKSGIIEVIPGRAQVKTGYRKGPNFH